MIRKFTYVIATAIVLLAPLRAEAQTKWFKYEKNPVLDVGPLGAWDHETILAAQVIFKDSLYRMWYGGLADNAIQTGYATSRDGVNWAKYVSNPILHNDPANPWESVGAVNGYVMFEDTVYRMWYNGIQNPGIYRIGYATSPDGIVWTKHSSNPILGPASWYYKGLSIPSVLPGTGGSYQMWFAGESSGLQIGYAKGSNPTTWTPNTDVALPYGAVGSWDDRNVFGPRVLSNGQGGYEMWFGGNRGGVSQNQFGYATSPDGVNWTPYDGNPVFSPSPGSWDAGGFNVPVMLYDGNVYHMWYSGGIANTWRVGYAVSPKGTNITVSPNRNSIDRNLDTVRVLVRVADPTGLSFSVEIESPDESPVDTLTLFDDGAHGDSLASDGLFANLWIPGDRNSYYLDLKLILHDTLKFEMNNIKLFAPVTFVREGKTPQLQQFSLGQNYPNPFNPTTVINYQLRAPSGVEGPVIGDVRLAVFDLVGREVAVLVNERKEPGRYEVKFDASGLASGIYFCRLFAGAYRETKKMILVR